MAQRILISTGGSGGHVVPATILYEHLKDRFHVSIMTDSRGVKYLDKKKYRYTFFNRRLHVSTLVLGFKNFKN